MARSDWVDCALYIGQDRYNAQVQCIAEVPKLGMDLTALFDRSLVEISNAKVNKVTYGLGGTVTMTKTVKTGSIFRTIEAENEQQLLEMISAKLKEAVGSKLLGLNVRIKNDVFTISHVEEKEGTSRAVGEHKESRRWLSWR